MTENEKEELFNKLFMGFGKKLDNATRNKVRDPKQIAKLINNLQEIASSNDDALDTFQSDFDDNNWMTVSELHDELQNNFDIDNINDIRTAKDLYKFDDPDEYVGVNAYGDVIPLDLYDVKDIDIDLLNLAE